MKKQKRPPLVTWLSVAVLILSLANLVAFVGGLMRQSLLLSLNLSLPVWWLEGFAAIWAGIWLVLAYGLFRMLPWARLGTMIALPLYGLMNLGQVIFFARGTYERLRLPFVLVSTVLLTGVMLFLLSRMQVRQVAENAIEEVEKPEE